MPRPSKIYFENKDYDIGNGHWVLETDVIRHRVVDPLNQPRWAEIYIKDSDHQKQVNGYYNNFRRLVIVDGETNKITFLGRVEFCEVDNQPEGDGPTLKLQAKDHLAEYEYIAPIDHDFRGKFAGGLFRAVAQYYRYTELILSDVQNDFIVGNYITAKTLGLEDGTAKIIYWDNTTNRLIITEVSDYRVDVEDWAAFRIDNYIYECKKDPDTKELVYDEYYVPVPTDNANYAKISEVIYNIDIKDLPTDVYPVSYGNYTNNSMSVLKALQQIATQIDGNDFYIDNGSSTDSFDPDGTFLYPVSFHYSSRDVRIAEGLVMIFGYDLIEADTPITTINYNPDYIFPIPEKERNTIIQVESTSDPTTGSTKIVGEAFNSELTATSRINKKLYTQNNDTVTTDKLDSQAESIRANVNKTAQRGIIKINKYPAYWNENEGRWCILRAGDCVQIYNSRLSTVNNITMMVTSIDYEESPGVATIDLIGVYSTTDGDTTTWHTTGLASEQYSFGSQNNTGVKEITNPIDTRITRMAGSGGGGGGGGIPLTTITAKGDLIIGTGHSAVTRLPAGVTANQVLKNDGSGNITWESVS